MPGEKRQAARRKTPPATPEQNFAHLQPQAPEMEKAVLGAILIEKEAFSLVSEILKPASFYEPRHQAIYEAIVQLNLAQKPVDILTVTEQLNQNGKLEDVGGPYYISELSNIVGSSAHVEYHARIVAQKSLARELITYTSNIQTKAFDSTTDVDELMQEAEGKLFELSQANLKKDYTLIDPVIEQAKEILNLAASRGGGMNGVPSGYSELDSITNGWQNSDLIILAARPSMGKTAFALSMAKNIAVDNRIPVAFFSLEMSNVQLVNRLITNVCEIKGDQLRSAQLSNDEWDMLNTRLKKLYGAPLYLDDTASLSIFELRSKARRLVREHDVRVILIDYLQLMNASGSKFNSRQEEVSIISRGLKGLAKELNIPIIALSQLNRNLQNREGVEGKRPQLSDLRESGAIEQDADIVCFIHRPYYYGIKDFNGVDMHDKAEIVVAKHRNGRLGIPLLRFVSDFARFEDIDPELLPTEEGNGMIIASRLNGPDEGPPMPEPYINGAEPFIPPAPVEAPF